ncbi:uncharacterized protein LOC126234758 [Schistocerca nitens]|uniref:uncharacterized protein LOC126234758 n=1 Tax=Schistocerca nitens TaxID=7011 RepID=UPI0021192980|nr:uncharacterized protein LOC126234758 [Schistocerca nitens]
MTGGGRKQMKRPFSKIGGKRTKNFEHSQNCDSDTSETYEYLRPGSYKVPMKHSAEVHNKTYNSEGLYHSSFKPDSAGGINNKKVLSEIKTCFSKNATVDMPHKTDSKIQQNDILHHKSVSGDDNVMEKMDKTNSLVPSYPKHTSNGKRPTVYWNKNEHQLPRCHSYYNARQRERFCHRRTENRNRNTSVSCLNSTMMNAFENQIPVMENSQNFSIMKKCKLENNTFTAM